MALRFAREPLTDALWAEVFPLLRSHWREVAAFPDIPLEPDRDLYRHAEANGALRVFTAREPNETTVRHLDGQRSRQVVPLLVGYAAFFVRSNPHYKSSIQAVQDVLYLDPAYRGVSAVKFIAWCDAALAADGVQVVMQHLKVKSDHARLMAHLGYEPVDTIYAKRLDVVADVEQIDSASLPSLRELAPRMLSRGLANMAEYPNGHPNGRRLVDV